MTKIRTKLFVAFLIFIVIPWVVISSLTTYIYTENLKEKYTQDIVNILEQSIVSFELEMTIAEHYLDIMFTSETLNNKLTENNFDVYNFALRKNIMDIDSYISSLIYNDEFISGGTIFIKDKPISSSKFSYWGDTIQQCQFFKDIDEANGGIVVCESIKIKDEYFREHEFILIGRQLKKINSLTNGLSISNETIGKVVLFIDSAKVTQKLMPMLNSKLELALTNDKGIIFSDIKPEVFDEIKSLELEHLRASSASQVKGSFNFLDKDNDKLVLYAKTQSQKYAIYATINKSNIYNNINFTVTSLIIVQVFSIIVFLIFTGITRTMITTPIQKIEHAMKDISKGNFDTVIYTNSKDELGEMTNSFNYLVSTLKEMIEQIHNDYKVKNEMEISMLQYQINPHFIYNILSTIRLKAMMNDDNNVADMLLKVSRLLSRTIGKSGKEILLSTEITNIEDYIYIQKYIFHNNFNVNISIASETANCIVPNMLLQPIVENCFVHGASEMSDYFCIFIKSKLTDKDLVITISDDGIGMSEEIIGKILSEDNNTKDRFSKIGIRSINKRLKLSYGDNYGVSIVSKLNCYTKVTIIIPAIYRNLNM